MNKVIMVTVSADDEDEGLGDNLYAELLGYLDRNDCVVEYAVQDGGIG